MILKELKSKETAVTFSGNLIEEAQLLDSDFLKKTCGMFCVDRRVSLLKSNDFRYYQAFEHQISLKLDKNSSVTKMICAHMLGLSQSQLGMNREAHFSFMPFEQPNSSRFIRNVRLNDRADSNLLLRIIRDSAI